MFESFRGEVESTIEGFELARLRRIDAKSGVWYDESMMARCTVEANRVCQSSAEIVKVQCHFAGPSEVQGDFWLLWLECQDLDRKKRACSHFTARVAR